MAVSPAEFDRQEFVRRLANRIKTAKVVEIKLSPKGMGLGELKSALGREFVCEQLADGNVRIGMKQAAPKPEAEVAAE